MQSPQDSHASDCNVSESIRSLTDMPDVQFDQLFLADRTVELVPVRALVDWFGRKQEPRLGLPPIQRSLVWRNEQILNYWDSLLRGYPAGTMMVHRTIPPRPGKELVARDSENKTRPIAEGDFQLFDGQQRLSAILLGFGRGQLSSSLKLWVDLGRPGPSGDRSFELRINSEGQPFGYVPETPNEKLPVEARRAALDDWRTLLGLSTPSSEATSPTEIFRSFAASETAGLARAECAVSLRSVIEAEARGDSGLAELYSLQGADPAVASRLVRAVRIALSSQVILQLVGDAILAEEEYVRFFARLGQGGTRLTDDELTYCLIKNRYPYIHDRMQAIVEKTGRFISEVDLVLGALRVAKAVKPWPNAKDWERRNRPTPKLIEELRSAEKKPTEEYFLTLVPAEADGSALSGALRNPKKALLFCETHPTGLPAMLLARMPRELLDVLLLFAIKRGPEAWEGKDRNALTAFALHWLCFVEKEAKASEHCYGAAIAEGWTFGPGAIACLMRGLERDGAARKAPRRHEWDGFEGQAAGRGSRLASWEERFISVKQDDGADTGLAVRVLSTNRELIRRALLWLQRTYISASSPNYDPTSTRDDDLPFDLDHAIPYEIYGANWQTVWRRLQGSDLPEDVRESFRHKRNEIGDSLGNFRWLEASLKRARQNNKLEDEWTKQPLVDDVDRQSTKHPVVDDLDRHDWNALIEKDRWSQEDIATFQRMIDSRTIRLAKRYVEESGISDLLAVADSMSED